MASVRRPLLACALVLGVTACGSSPGPSGATQTTTSLAVGGGIATAPALSGRALPEVAGLTRLDSGAAVGFGDLAGTPAVINLWFSSCAPCKEEMPAFEAVHRRVGPAVRFVGLNTGEGAPLARRFLAEDVSVSYEQWHDPTAAVPAALRIPSFPATLFVAADGRLVKAVYGALSAERLERTIDEVLR